MVTFKIYILPFGNIHGNVTEGNKVIFKYLGISLSIIL